MTTAFVTRLGARRERALRLAAPLRTHELSLDLADIESRLAAAFIARFGVDLGKEITAEAMAWAWENQEKLQTLSNPAGYLYRVGQSKSRKFLRWKREQVRFPAERGTTETNWTEPALPDALARLSEQERTAVVLVHCFQWTYREVAELLDVPLHTVRNRIHRGLAQLRTDLGVDLHG